ncbi:amidohydrolase [Shimia sp. R9_1]|uniref:amidohydrolase n=1 Tax=Shimia sp. R9_1 TaxID=2821111 RepID=UPI001AD9E358|nr:amidohydrolase [Shimia sp. R9_1]MBO9408507.1 amidohydrolase [Shimia sp. R9_1]
MSYELTTKQITDLTALRHALHETPEISGEEAQTAAHIAEALRQAGADQIWTGLGGHGVAAAFEGKAAGPTVMIRCELDGLPIHEVSDLPYRSQIDGKSHVCGHDGHMTMVMGCALALARRPARGRVILLFQPAEETGRGAPAVVDDPRWSALKPDYVFAIHNLPGLALGTVGLCAGTACCASRGMQIRLAGKSSHAAMPEDGVSPAGAMAELMTALPALSRGGALDEAFRLCTLTHCSLGEPTFGIAPGDGEIRCTLRCVSDATMQGLIEEAETAVTEAAARHGLEAEITWHDVFAATVNADEAVQLTQQAAQATGLAVEMLPEPMRFSEDFGCFGLDGATTAMIFLGSGVDQPQLHNPDFDFPDALIPHGTHLFLNLITQLLEA